MQQARKLVDNAFGEQLLALRLSAGLTQEELAERSLLSVRTIGDIERGRRPVPYPATARLLADALGIEGEQRERLLGPLVRERQTRATRNPAAAASPPDREPAIVGRETEIAAIERRLAGGERLLTLVGPGGIGKSCLAQAIAARHRRSGSRVLEVSLEGVSAPDLVLPAIARAAGMPLRGAKLTVSRVAAFFGPSPLLLILDNFDHLLAASATVVALLDEAASLTMLVTSREALRVRHESTLAVPPLSLPAADAGLEALTANPAVALFLRALAADAPTRPYDSDDPVHAAAIVRLLDGLPLAIELAAAQAALIPLASVASLLENAGLAALARGRRDAPARFATMAAAIAWSADLLPPEAQRLFRQLAVFRGGFTAAAVHGVACEAGDKAMFTAFPLLAEAHLIEPDPAEPNGRLRMLEPVRLFAEDRLRASGEEPAARRAHAAWFLRWARQQAQVVAGPEPVPALDALDADIANLQTAFAHAAPENALATASALSQYWELRNRLREGRAILAEALAAIPATAIEATPAIMDGIYWSGCLAYLQSDLPLMDEDIERLRPLATADGSPEYVARILLLEVLRRDLASLPRADSIDLAREAHALMQDGPKEVSWHMSAVVLANLLVQNGDIGAALPLLHAYAEWAQDRAAAVHANVAGDWLGFALLETGEVAEARARFAQSIAWSSDSALTGTVYLPLLGYILATAVEGAPLPDLELAAVLLGALDTDIDRHGYPLGDHNTAALAACRARMAAVLGDGPFAALLARGRALPLVDAIDLVIA
ncbi:MAG: ATP-binding protein [Thermomicrobiales bacterium]